MTSTTTLAGQAIGEGDRSKTRSTLLVMTGLIMAIYIVLSILLLAFMKPLIGLYGAAPDVVPIVRTLLLSLLVPMTLFWPAGYIVAAGLRAAGDVKHVMLVAIVSMWTMRVGGAYFLVKVADMGILGLWISMYADWVFRVAFFGNGFVGDRGFKVRI
jgi:Na+-driven multidrug efflux pump